MASKRPAFRENIHRLFDEAQAVDLAPGIVSLIESKATHAQIREIPVNKILPNPAQPRLSYEEDSLTDSGRPEAVSCSTGAGRSASGAGSWIQRTTSPEE